MSNEIKTTGVFPLNDNALIKEKVLSWLKQFGTFSFLDSCGYPGSAFDFVAAAGVTSSFSASQPDVLAAFQQYATEKKRWLFGHFSYELNVDPSFPRSKKKDYLLFPDIHFFEPENIVIARADQLTIIAVHPERIFNQIHQITPIKDVQAYDRIAVQCRVDKTTYIDTIERLQAHMHRGDCYEVNYCIEFFAEKAEIDPFAVYEALIKRSPNPFSGIYRLADKWLICASPERFLKKTADRLISQPIKGTLLRKATDPETLQLEQQLLYSSEKDRAENVMVVDLVRNDLARVCKEGSVTVDELFGIYTFNQVHQMISTVSGLVNTSVTTLTDLLKATYPMGSMTGAPKISVMQLIDQYEKAKRGIFSGSIGYINPEGDFDFNVVIRSLMYNAASHYLSYQAGSGITIYSDPEKEWEECLLKAAAIEAVLKNDLS